MNTCEHCKQDTESGEYYEFYYGSLLSSDVTFRAGDKITTSKFSITGSEKTFLCSKCIIPRIINKAIFACFGNILLAIVAFAVGLFLKFKVNDIIGWIFLILVACLLTLSIFSIVIRQIILPVYFQLTKNQSKIKEILSEKRNWYVGDSLAVDIKRAQFSGYAKFTRDHYNNLAKSR